MVRRLTVISLVVGLCLMGVIPGLAQKVYLTLAEYEKVTGKSIEAFNEAPSLKTRVAAGELPPVEERLPEEPMVVEPRDEIGQYGGTMKSGAMHPVTSGYDILNARTQNLAASRVSTHGVKMIPNIAKGWDLSKDYKTLTIYLRKGMKWSDGAPFNADDFLFWYEDIILDDELTPVKPKAWSPGGKLMKMEKVDDWTVRLQFAVPFPPAVEKLIGQTLCAPKHYLKKWHTKYNPKANEMAKKEGYDYWWLCFQYHNPSNVQAREEGFPTLNPWGLKKKDTFGNRYYERNPYYWKIDTAGDQLPYIDKQARILVESREVLNLKAIAGEFTFAGHELDLRDYTLYKEGEKKGGYHVVLSPDIRGSELAFTFNYTHKDPVLKKILNDVRWRQAMSLAINRDEINQILFFGKATPRQAIVDSGCSFYEDWMGKYYIEYDSERANKLLDEMGLKWDKKHHYRLRPDGKSLAITIEYCETGMGGKGPVCELVKEYWEKVGVEVALKEDQRSLYQQRLVANECDLGVWQWDGCSEFQSHGSRPIRLCPPWHWPGIAQGGVEWYNWYNTDGKTGEEPPEIIKRLFNLVDEWLTTARGTEKYLKIGKEILTINAKNLFAIGTVGLAPHPLIIKNTLRNAFRKGDIFSIEYEYGLWRPYQADQWFFKK